MLLIIKWKAREFSIEMSPESTVSQLQTEIEKQTGVAVAQQKLLGLGSSKSSTKHDAQKSLKDLGVRANQKIMLMGVTNSELNSIKEIEQGLLAKRVVEEAEEAERQRLELLARQEYERQLEVERRLDDERRQRAAEQQEAARRERQRLADQREAARQAMIVDDIDNRHPFGSRLNESFDASATMTTSLVVDLPDDVGNKSIAEQLEFGDKLLLPTSVLDELTTLRVPFPFVFRITKTLSSTSTTSSSTSLIINTQQPEDEEESELATHARVAEFTAKSGHCVMSRRLMDAIGVTSGERVTLTITHPQNGTKLALRPHSARWINIDEEERGAALSFCLRNYSTATLGTPLAISYRNDVWLFDVVNVWPNDDNDDDNSKTKENQQQQNDDNNDNDNDNERLRQRRKRSSVISLTNVDIEVDVLEPAEPIVPIAPLPIDGEPITLTLSSNELSYFAISLPRRNSPSTTTTTTTTSTRDDIDTQQFPIHIIAEPLDENSDPDLFCSQSTTRPNANDYDAQWRGRSEVILNLSNATTTTTTSQTTTMSIDARRAGALIYIAVLANVIVDKDKDKDATATTNSCRCTLRALSSEKFRLMNEQTSTSQSTGYRLGDASTTTSSITTTTSSSSTNSSTTSTDNMKSCSICGKSVPAQSLSIHELTCARNRNRVVAERVVSVTSEATFDTCERCHERLNLRQFEKHHRVRHRSIACPLRCGASMDADVIRVHKAEYCPMRLAACQYCAMRLPMVGERGRHQYICGALTAHCRRCDFASQRKEMKRHVVEAHGIPPVDVSHADWH